MGYLGRRIGLSQDNGDSNPGAAGGAVGGGLLDLFAHGYFERQGDIYNAPGLPPPPPVGLTATGGIISDYTDGPAVYRAHIFTSTGTFDVSAPGDFGDTVDFLVIGGGGGTGGMNGGYHGGGGGGAGLLHYKTGVSAPIATHPITIGAGGVGGLTSGSRGNQGGTTTFALSGSPTTAGGGGGGGAYAAGPASGGGGSGSGGGGRYDAAGGTSPGDTGHPGGLDVVSPPNGWGNDGGSGPNSPSGSGGSGGGGAAALGVDGVSGGAGGAGGIGGRYSIGGILNTSLGTDGPNPGRYFAGGGSGGHTSGPGAATAAVAGGGGASKGGSPTSSNAVASRGVDGIAGTGGGAGAPNAASPSVQGAQGGSGTVIVRYQIGELTAIAKATGGSISYYGGKTIHTFTGSGTFATTSDWSPTNVEYVVIGGGGGGSGWDIGGAGGAGAFLSNINHPIGTHPVSVLVQVGGGGQGCIQPSYTSPTHAAYGTNGTESYFGAPLTAPGGGHGGSPAPPSTAGAPGGSGGGGGYYTLGGTGTGDPYPGTPGVTPANGWGHDGAGQTTGSPRYGSGGGGGAGEAGGSGDPEYAGYGGNGVQVPSTFRNPASQPGPGTGPQVGGGLGTPGPGSTYFWVAGGGGGATEASTDNPGTPSRAGTGGVGGGGRGGNNGPRTSESGVMSTGSGGGGIDGAGTGGNSGGSGVVLIAYPS